MKTDTFTIEAVRNNKAKLHVPNLHIIIERSKDNEELWIGHCLDLNICAYSSKETKEDISEEIFNTITEMTITMILYHLDKGIIKDLLKFSVENHGKWDRFNKFNNIKKIDALEKSYTNLISKEKEKVIGKSLSDEQINSLIDKIRSEFKDNNIYELRVAA